MRFPGKCSEALEEGQLPPGFLQELPGDVSIAFLPNCHRRADGPKETDGGMSSSQTVAWSTGALSSPTPSPCHGSDQLTQTLESGHGPAREGLCDLEENPCPPWTSGSPPD